MQLNDLERATLDRMVRQYKQDGSAASIVEQIEHVKVKSRENTGCGFYTILEASPFDSPIPDEIVAGVFADICGLRNPLALVLYIRDGFVHLLEGAATDESTENLDFSQAGFKIREP